MNLIGCLIAEAGLAPAFVSIIKVIDLILFWWV